MDLGTILIVVGLFMAWSGFSAKQRMDHYGELAVRGVKVDPEYGYHVLFRKVWWIPVGIGISLIFFS